MLNFYKLVNVVTSINTMVARDMLWSITAVLTQSDLHPSYIICLSLKKNVHSFLYAFPKKTYPMFNIIKLVYLIVCSNFLCVWGGAANSYLVKHFIFNIILEVCRKRTLSRSKCRATKLHYSLLKSPKWKKGHININWFSKHFYYN